MRSFLIALCAFVSLVCCSTPAAAPQLLIEPQAVASAGIPAVKLSLIHI